MGQLQKVLIGIGLFILLAFFIVRLSVYIVADGPTADDIPHYPNALFWKVTYELGYPDGSPGSTIEFYTNDPLETVISYYKGYFQKEGFNITLERKDKEAATGNDYRELRVVKDLHLGILYSRLGYPNAEVNGNYVILVGKY